MVVSVGSGEMLVYCIIIQRLLIVVRVAGVNEWKAGKNCGGGLVHHKPSSCHSDL